MFIDVLFVASILALHTTLTVSKPDIPAPCAHAIPAEWIGGDQKPKKGWKCSPQGFTDEPVLSKPGEVVLSQSFCDLGYSITSSKDGTLSTNTKGNVTVDKFLCKDSGFPEPLICDPGSPSGVFNWCYPGAFLYKDTPWIYKEAKKANGGEDADDRGKAATGNIFASSNSTSSTSASTKFPRGEAFLFVIMCIWANI
ncbi:uncharacterized protein MELLADRAFT_109783 [Melampsora larici-populina 98AG31]|uniref:Secreted protein n=1 Tax=Melampsora larici-populina (strain 98AG31 / pathotype 3-4-7) TaxID=747676 RepID=F4RXM3_MELLP|nr:uncharacterized protein MELLADRAFT_109783 [Melampsora larici-populina 98AG31]EGG02749.1 hypothetical protein MELLADRAFT_109783 [Melampsora larici-populina 98AG31]